MRTPTLLATLLLAATASAQGTAFYAPDNDPTAGSCNVIPFGNVITNSSWVNQRYQQIVTVADLNGTAGLVTGIGFAPCASGEHRSDTIRITLAHVPSGFSFQSGNTNFDNNLHVLGSNATVVLDQTDYSWVKTGDAWSSIGLDESFAYNGTDDLLVDILVTGNDSTNSSNSAHTGARPRLYERNWTGSPPAVGRTSSTAALKIQIQMGCADTTTFGAGCGGLVLGFSGSAALGSTLNIHATNGAATMPIVLNIGTLAGPPFPLDLTSAGFPGCFMLNSNDAPVGGVTDAGGNATVSLTVPNTTTLTNVRLFFQWAHINLSAPNGVALSNAGRAVLGPVCP